MQGNFRGWLLLINKSITLTHLGRPNFKSSLLTRSKPGSHTYIVQWFSVILLKKASRLSNTLIQKQVAQCVSSEHNKPEKGKRQNTGRTQLTDQPRSCFSTDFTFTTKLAVLWIIWKGQMELSHYPERDFWSIWKHLIHLKQQNKNWAVITCLKLYRAHEINAGEFFFPYLLPTEKFSYLKSHWSYGFKKRKWFVFFLSCRKADTQLNS